ncbi:response regulator [Hydrogenophaga sp.]|uniref:response regulator n=1 Tax=Hydrogenophaga sp. TaxID=1904254 RepID=UPI0025C24555|nr:response regulator [Hydrogenophaga sp.]MBT9462818.1 response regulator [Hydrogenophaga sp.]
MSVTAPIQRVVLIDDSENDNFFHEIALRKAGFDGEIQIFESGERALEFLVQDQISVSTLVLLDINMPGMNGFDVARALTDRLQPRAALQVHMLTSSAWSVDKATAQSIDLIRNYLVKPLTKEAAAALLDVECFI